MVLRHGVQLDEAGLIQWAREHMANYKVPRVGKAYDALPVNASNKVAKNELRAGFM